MTSFLRPDELASQSRIRSNQERDAKLKKGGKAALSIATTFGGLAVANKVLPFLSELIPVDLALKGISKVSPKIGNFLKRGMEQGLNVKDGLQFLREGINKQQEQPKEEKNPKNLKEAERIVALNKFNAQKQQRQKAPTMQERERERFNQQYGGLQAQQGQPQPINISSQENTDQALLAALEKILQM